ncbi:hypothetical protein CBF34_10575 [Vagococcus penaei]|uniref:Uncharacterized protein n=1 Tax=Vagococcus penaei TaxID=633807 RepID=A0A1Q2D3G8_9ENTE|nr:hypothetical protein [Vagococcus penaei]AQP52861.1 hypothetical protein BW732_00565 [Vagococcus penaei]RST98170.1 hypothetical protein CBF34_10575 [Vagococcus penaei]
MADTNQVNYKNQDLTIRMDEMTETEMYALYQLAIKKNDILTIQKNILTIDNLQPLKSITGHIKGFNEVGLYLENEFIYFTDIKCVTLSKDKKWSDLSKY